MSWARYDDMLPMNKKWASLRAYGTDGAAALGLHLLANTYSRHNGTGGVVDKHVVEMLVGKCGSKLARLLVEVGMFDVESDGWKIHDFAEYHDPSDPNPDRSANDRQKEISRSRAEAGRKGGLAKASKATDLPEAKSWQTSSPVPVPEPVTTTPQPPGGGVHPKQVAREAAELLLKHELNVSRTGPWLASVTERLLNEYDCTALTPQQIHDLERPDAVNPYAPRPPRHDPACVECAGSGWRTVDVETNSVAPCDCTPPAALRAV